MTLLQETIYVGQFFLLFFFNFGGKSGNKYLQGSFSVLNLNESFDEQENINRQEKEEENGPPQPCVGHTCECEHHRG